MVETSPVSQDKMEEKGSDNKGEEVEFNVTDQVEAISPDQIYQSNVESDNTEVLAGLRGTQDIVSDSSSSDS